MSELAIFPATLGDSGVYTCQSVSLNDAGAVANVTVIVTSGKKIGGKIQIRYVKLKKSFNISKVVYHIFQESNMPQFWKKILVHRDISF